MRAGLNEEAKRYFRYFVNNEDEVDAHKALYERIALFKPKRVFEFGCGTGKNIARLKAMTGCEGYGIDISTPALAIAKDKYKVEAEVGDEVTLHSLEGGYDVAFTVSVLDHIPEIGGIMEDLRRIAKHIVVLETNEKGVAHPHWWAHDYEFYGLEKVAGPFRTMHANRAAYYIWSDPLP